MLTSGGGAIWGCWCCLHADTPKLLQVHVQPGCTEFVERRHHPCYNTKIKLKSRGTEERDIPPPAIIPSRNGRRCGRGRDGRDGGLSPRTTDQHQKTTGLASSWATAVCPYIPTVLNQPDTAVPGLRTSSKPNSKTRLLSAQRDAPSGLEVRSWPTRRRRNLSWP